MKPLKSFFICVFIILALIIFNACKAPSGSVNHGEQLKYLPKEVSNLYLGMKLDEFKKKKELSRIDLDEGTYVTYAIEKYSGDNIIGIQYQFDGDKLLYEFVIEYGPETDIKKEFTAKFGVPNDGEEWKFDNKTGFNLKIWVYQNRLCIADARHF